MPSISAQPVVLVAISVAIAVGSLLIAACIYLFVRRQRKRGCQAPPLANLSMREKHIDKSQISPPIATLDPEALMTRHKLRKEPLAIKVLRQLPDSPAPPSYSSNASVNSATRFIKTPPSLPLSPPRRSIVAAPKWSFESARPEAQPESESDKATLKWCESVQGSFMSGRYSAQERARQSLYPTTPTSSDIANFPENARFSRQHLDFPSSP
ncbi:hypothetical protein EMMF5_006120 [Cystobasidiomycetes sp. EMM_F5]